jgi:hypothetical protein
MGAQDVTVSPDSGIRDVIPKPFTADELELTLDRLFGGRDSA